MPARKKRLPRPRTVSPARLRARVRAICLALPQTQCEDRGDYSTFRVKTKVFAYFLDNHHGDGIVSVCVKTELGENVDRAHLDPERCYLPAYIGPRGWLGFRLDRGEVDWREVAELVERSFRQSAPKRLLARLDSA
jgi:predicted DNA-binding protein (MmcQ/YjbR family)